MFLRPNPNTHRSRPLQLQHGEWNLRLRRPHLQSRRGVHRLNRDLRTSITPKKRRRMKRRAHARNPGSPTPLKPSAKSFKVARLLRKSSLSAQHTRKPTYQKRFPNGCPNLSSVPRSWRLFVKRFTSRSIKNPSPRKLPKFHHTSASPRVLKRSPTPRSSARRSTARHRTKIPPSRCRPLRTSLPNLCSFVTNNRHSHRTKIITSTPRRFNRSRSQANPSPRMANRPPMP